MEVGPDTSTYCSLLFPLSFEQTRSSRATVEDPAGVAADPLESHRDLGSSRGLHDTVAQRPPSDGRVESKRVVEPAHEIDGHMTDQVADPFNSDRSHLFGLYLAVVAQTGLSRVNSTRNG